MEVFMMEYFSHAAFFIIGMATFSSVLAADKSSLNVKAEGIRPDGFVDPEYAYGVMDEKTHMKQGVNKNIGLSWSKGPQGTKSYAIVAVDPDVPSVFDDAGKEGKVLPADMQRRNFYHWVLLDIPLAITSIPAGADSGPNAKTPKSEVKTPYGVRGVNDYSPDNLGYDGPCPPWNDERMHHYHFKVFALDVPSLGISGRKANGMAALEAIKNHVLAEGEVMGKYTLNPALKNK
jgi:Raf kinase inhibitor-like YbhB/YbcL family protein